jgi:hypothetical protein
MRTASRRAVLCGCEVIHNAIVNRFIRLLRVSIAVGSLSDGGHEVVDVVRLRQHRDAIGD